MEQVKPGQTLPPYAPNKNGYVLIIIVLILASVFSVVLIKISLQSISLLQRSSLNIAQTNLATLTQTCAHENLINLTRNPDFSGTTINILNGACISNININGEYREIGLLVNMDRFYDSVTITFDPSQKKIIDWDN